MYSDELTELLLAEEPVPAELIRKVLREATIAQHDRAGAVRLGAATASACSRCSTPWPYYLPSPADVPPVEGIDPDKEEDAKLIRKPDPDEPFCGLVFKIQADRHGDLHYVRVYSGALKANSRVYNPGKDKKENVPQLWHIQADRPQSRSKRVEAGDIVGIIGLRHSITGDTLCDTQRADPAGVDQFPGNGHLDGHRAGEHRPSARSWPTCWR